MHKNNGKCTGLRQVHRNDGNAQNRMNCRKDDRCIEMMSHLCQAPDPGQQSIEGCLACLHSQQLLLGYLGEAILMN